MSTPNHADSAAVKPQRLDSQRSVIKSHIPPGPVFWKRSWGRRRVKRRGSAAPSRPHEREEPRKKAAQGEPRPGHGAHGAKPRASIPRSEPEAAEGATRPRGFGGQRGPAATGARPPEPPGTRRRSGGRRTGGGRSRSAGRKPRAHTFLCPPCHGGLRDGWGPDCGPRVPARRSTHQRARRSGAPATCAAH